MIHQHKKCITQNLERVRKICEEKLLDFTPARKKVLEIILSNQHKSIKAYDILKKIKSNKPPIVYRALDFLLENKIIHKINSVNGYIACYKKNSRDNCCFFLCVNCKNIFEYQSRKMESCIEKVASRNKTKVQNVNLEIASLCVKCSKVRCE